MPSTRMLGRGQGQIYTPKGVSFRVQVGVLSI